MAIKKYFTEEERKAAKKVNDVKWRKNNKERFTEIKRKWREKNKDKVSETNRRWREKHDGGVIYGLYFDDNLIYIGQTKNLKLRINSHKSNAKRKDKINLEMYTYLSDKEFTYKILEKEENIKLRLDKELELIKKYEPRFNKEGR